VAVNPTSNRIYVVTADSFLRIIDGTTNAVVASVPVPNTCCGFKIAVNQSTNRVYVVSGLTNALTVIDGLSGAILASPTLSPLLFSVAVNSTNNRVYVLTDSSILTLDGATNTVLSTLPLSVEPGTLAINPNTNRLYVTQRSGPGLLVVDTVSNSVVTSIAGGAAVNARDVSVNPTTNRVYTPGINGGISIISGASNTVVANVSLPVPIVGIGVNPVTNRVYASDANSSRVFAIDDSPLVPTATATPTSVTPIATATRSPTPTNEPPAATATPTPTGGVAGKSFGLSSDASGVHLSWQTGSGQAGYSVARLANGVWSFLPAAGLGANETSFVDTSPPPGLVCYALLIAGTNPQKYSDAFCALVGFRTPTGSPQIFTARLNQSNTASLTWSPPPGGGQDSYLLVTLGGTAQTLPGTTTSISLPANGLTCYALGARQNEVLMGYADIVCGLTGFSNLGPTSG